MANLALAGEVDVDDDQVRGVLAAVAPIVGTTRVVPATANIVRALGLALDLAEFDEELADERRLSIGQLRSRCGGREDDAVMAAADAVGPEILRTRQRLPNERRKLFREE